MSLCCEIIVSGLTVRISRSRNRRECEQRSTTFFFFYGGFREKFKIHLIQLTKYKVNGHNNTILQSRDVQYF